MATGIMSFFFEWKCWHVLTTNFSLIYNGEAPEKEFDLILYLSQSWKKKSQRLSEWRLSWQDPSMSSLFGASLLVWVSKSIPHKIWTYWFWMSKTTSYMSSRALSRNIEKQCAWTWTIQPHDTSRSSTYSNSTRWYKDVMIFPEVFTLLTCLMMLDVSFPMKLNI